MTRTLRTGTRGPDVLSWQRFLESQGFSPGSPDGAFGPKTAEATRAFQTQNGLVADGVVGPRAFGKAGELGLRMARRLTNAELNPQLIEQARRILKDHHDDLYGTEVPFELDGIRYFGRIEEHFHPPGGPRKPWGHHPGVSLFIEGPVDQTVETHDETTDAPGDADADPVEPAAPVAARGVIVIDPGHGGTATVGGSSANNAKSPHGVLEKDLTLDMAKRIRSAIVERALAVQVELTRSTDENLGLADRARLAARTEADVFLSLHFNGFNGTVRGTETHVRPKASGNLNFADDRRFAERVLQATHRALLELDPNAKNRGVFEKALGVLRDDFLGNTPAKHPCRACLLELEFLDVPAVDALFNTGPNAEAVKQRVATAIAGALIEEVGG